MYFGMRRSGRRTPVPSHKSFCFRTGDPGFTSRVDGWALSWGFFCSSAFGLVCAAAGDWSLELLPGGGVWLNAVDAKNQRKKAQRRVIDLLLSPNGEHAVGRSPETQAATRDIDNCPVKPPCPASQKQSREPSREIWRPPAPVLSRLGYPRALEVPLITCQMPPHTARISQLVNRRSRAQFAQFLERYPQVKERGRYTRWLL